MEGVLEKELAVAMISSNDGVKVDIELFKKFVVILQLHFYCNCTYKKVING